MKMSYAKAEAIVARAVHARKKFGRQAMTSVSQDDLLDALVAFSEGAPPEDETGLKAQLTKANRQLAALNARYTALEQRYEVAKSALAAIE
jgi:hypothetical protein